MNIPDTFRTFRGLILDGDGVWFTGEEYRAVLPDGGVIVMKPRHHHDGQGLTFLRALGVKVLFATGEGEPMGSVVEKLNGLPSVKDGTFGPVSVLMHLKDKNTKVPAIEKWLSEQGLTWGDCVYVGDDRTDLEAMIRCNEGGGLTVTPGNGLRLIKKVATLTLSKDGGKGAIRELAEMVLDARGVDEATLPAA